jgi:hypothetical protein
MNVVCVRVVRVSISYFTILMNVFRFSMPFQYSITNTGLAILHLPNIRLIARPCDMSVLRGSSRYKRRRPSGLYSTGGGNAGWAEAATDGSVLRACGRSRVLPCWTLSAALRLFVHRGSLRRFRRRGRCDYKWSIGFYWAVLMNLVCSRHARIYLIFGFLF